jgi:hypothetical protein
LLLSLAVRIIRAFTHNTKHFHQFGVLRVVIKHRIQDECVPREAGVDY